MTKEDYAKLAEAKRKNPGAGRETLAGMTGLTPGMARKWLLLNGLTGKSTTKTYVTSQKIKESVKGIKVSEFLMKMDYPAIIRKSIKDHCEESFLPESEFRVLTGLSQSSFTLGKNAGVFSDNLFKQENIVYWSTVKNVLKAKKMRGR